MSGSGMTLPDMGSLSFRAATVPQTGEFWQMSRGEAKERNENGGCEPITQEEYVKTKDGTHRDKYFRIRHMYKNSQGTYNYDIFDSSNLWTYVSDASHKGRNPMNYQKIWLEDWMALKNKYSPKMIDPGFVARLPSLTHPVKMYDNGRLVRIEWPDGQVKEFKGEKGEEYRVRSVYADGHVVHFEGKKDKEHIVTIHYPDGKSMYYKGEKGMEYLVHTKSSNNILRYFEKDEDGRPKLLYSMYPDGRLVYPQV